MAPTIPIDFSGQRESKNFSISKTGPEMGKSRKVSKGFSSVFVPDYRHAVETVADSEGFESSGMELTVPEESSAVMRKCSNLNVDGYGVSGVPRWSLSLSKMSDMEKRDLGMRLNSELEQVRLLQKKIHHFFIMNTKDINENGSNKVESIPMPMTDAGMVQGRKIFRPGRNSSRNKGGFAGPRTKGGSGKQGVSNSNDFFMLMKQCETLLSRMMAHQKAWIFNEPVDIAKHNCGDYFNVIKHPMDLGTVKRKLISGQYSNPMGFAADVRLTFKNAMTYNPAGHLVYVMAETMSKYFETRWKPIEKKIQVTANESMLASKPSIIVEHQGSYIPPAKKQKTTFMENKANHEPCARQMSEFEKQKLAAELEAEFAELPEDIVDFIKKSCSNGRQLSEDEIEIDIDTLNDDTLFTVRRILDDYLQGKQNKSVKVEPCEMETRNGSALSNLSAQHHGDHERADEYVDIGGDDPPPVSNSTPMETDRSAARRNSNCGSSSSSSSDSGSSSSDSNSRSSASELDVVNNAVQETEGPTVERKESDAPDPNSGDFLNGRAEQNAPSNSSIIESSCPQEGESGPSDKKVVSPDKVYRAALLRSRFADIIIKAQENTIEKGERPDPEKLKLEKEELERRRREEKARLQAEAKAAEEVIRKAEEEALAEARRKRELEREAARQALQMMEKTVDISESSQFIEDLEMFKVAPDENLQSDGSPTNSQNGLGNFKFPATSNPLEQLGLYMKNDEEEDEEEEEKKVEPQRSPVVTQDDSDFEMFKVAPDENLQSDGSPTNFQNGLGSFKFPATSNPLEQLGLNMKNNEEEDEEEEEKKVEPQRSPVVTQDDSDVEID